jgi:curved DNA-binding protein CbpA
VDDGPTLYALLGLGPDATSDALRAAYRRRAAALHPDRADGASTSHAAMVELNAAWAVLSDPDRRSRYDAQLVSARIRGRPPARGQPPAPRTASTTTVADPPPVRPRPGTHPRLRREAWLNGIRVQVHRLGGQAGRSAALGLAVRRKGLPRAEYLEALDDILAELVRDTDRRVRAARAAGAAPLDLGLVTGLVGLRALADAAARGEPPLGDARRRRAVAEMVDRMWDTMAYEVPREVERALGGNPHASRTR